MFYLNIINKKKTQNTKHTSIKPCDCNRRLISLASVWKIL